MINSGLAHAQPHAELAPGVIIGPWMIRERWDKGSFGLVFKVTRAGHPEAGLFALKIALHVDDPRFPREVWLLQRTTHPSIPRFEDRGWWKSSSGWDFPYFVMEWVEGLPLYEWAQQQKPTSAQVLQVLAQLVGALAAAHAAGGVHRDVKGDNVLVTPNQRAILLDWGAGMYEGAKGITDTVLPPGTSCYRAPEAVRWAWAHRKNGKSYEAGPADDVYALGAMAYRLCTGTYPPAPEEGSLPQRRLFPPRELATVSMDLERLMLACLSQERRARPSAASLAVALAAAAGERDAAAPIAPTPAAADTASTPGPRFRWHWPAWASTAVAALGGGLIASALLLIAIHGGSEGPVPTPAPAREPDVALEQPAPEVPDGGVAAEVLASAARIPRDVSPYTTISATMPKQPFPGQKKPPCEPRAEREVLGACWSILKMTPPCAAAGFDYNGECLRAVMVEPRQPASEDPR
ncbi:MAG: serine/threonine protein kinase [Hyalangium sp.]|uniref:serine/threonine protein kinase n=1 Tax=Hyalangium sp. TaxID=2028555 RepID=UPI00389A1E4A